MEEITFYTKNTEYHLNEQFDGTYLLSGGQFKEPVEVNFSKSPVVGERFVARLSDAERNGNFKGLPFNTSVVQQSKLHLTDKIEITTKNGNYSLEEIGHNTFLLNGKGFKNNEVHLDLTSLQIGNGLRFDFTNHPNNGEFANRLCCTSEVIAMNCSAKYAGIVQKNTELNKKEVSTEKSHNKILGLLKKMKNKEKFKLSIKKSHSLNKEQTRSKNTHDISR